MNKINLSGTITRSKCLFLANGFSKEYHVLRCAAEACASVYVLGSPRAYRLKYSRFCAHFEEFNFDLDGPLENMIEQIERIARREEIDFVMASDYTTTLFLAKAAGKLSVSIFPVPDLETLQLLNNKWHFYKLCTSINVSVPETFLYQTADDLKKAIAAGRIKTPITVKPTELYAGSGVYHIMSPDALGLLDLVNYVPIVVQRHIIGSDVGVSMLSSHGKICAWTAQYFRVLEGSRDIFFRSDACFEAIKRIANETKFNGIAQFDARLESATDRIYFVECNPRFWLSVFMVLNAGLNYVSVGLSGGIASPDHILTIEPTEMPRLRGLIRKLCVPWQFTRNDFKLFRYLLSDPVVGFITLAWRARDRSRRCWR
jgi:hypothetical protein